MSIRVNVDGRVGTAEDPMISPLDHGFLFGASVYETVRTYGGRPFLLGRHLERLKASAAGLGIDIGVPDAELSSRVERTLLAARNDESSIRIIVSEGRGAVDYRAGSTPRSTVAVLVRPLPRVPPEHYETGVRVALVDILRNHPKSLSPSIKSSNLLNNLLAMRQAHERGAQEAVMLNHQGDVAEGSMTNIFLVRHGIVRTPSLETGILAGITREIVMEVAAESGFAVEETRFAPAELRSADEVFLTATGKEILPVVGVDDVVIGDGRPGRVTLALLAGYRKRAQELMHR